MWLRQEGWPGGEVTKLGGDHDDADDQRKYVRIARRSQQRALRDCSCQRRRLASLQSGGGNERNHLECSEGKGAEQHAPPEPGGENFAQLGAEKTCHIPATSLPRIALSAVSSRKTSSRRTFSVTRCWSSSCLDHAARPTCSAVAPVTLSDSPFAALTVTWGPMTVMAERRPTRSGPRTLTGPAAPDRSSSRVPCRISRPRARITIRSTVCSTSARRWLETRTAHWR